MSFIVFEGIDGSGKSTQVKKLTTYLESRGQSVKQLHFPRTASPYFGELVARFLRGELGSIENVDPYLVAMLYAGDRWDAGNEIRAWLNQGAHVLLDRYYYSNIAFQCAKTASRQEADNLSRWIRNLELDYFKIPAPDINLFLDVPQKFTKEKLLSERAGTDRSYLQGARDIHEESLDFQSRVRQSYIYESQQHNDLIYINCSDTEGNILDPDTVFEKIIIILSEKKII